MPSSTKNIIIRVILGVAFTALGYWLSHLYIHLDLFGIPFLLETIISFALGALAIFVFPLVGAAVSKWFAKSIQATVQSTVSKATGKFLATQKARLAEEGEKSSESSPKVGKKPLPKKLKLPLTLVDTSAIIDGRLLDIVKTDFLSGTLILPQFVLDELQRIADSSDDLKRGRGRRGMEVLEELKKELKSGFYIYDAPVGDNDVDSELVRLARELKARLVTVDFNLNKVASLADVQVLNVNDLANAVKTVVLPGERLTVRILQAGKEAGQGVAYLADGTMIVVENGGESIGREVEITVARALQTAAGRMVFAEVS